jgi:hypothetical protein
MQRARPAGLVFFYDPALYLSSNINLTCICLDHPSLANHACWDIQSVFTNSDYGGFLPGPLKHSDRVAHLPNSTRSTPSLASQKSLFFLSVTCKNSSGLWEVAPRPEV